MRQISDLQRGLIFHSPFDEWMGARDLVGGSTGIITAAYPTINNEGNGRRWLSGDGASSYVSLPSMPAFGTNDFSVSVKIKTNTIGSLRNIIGGASNAFQIYILSTGFIQSSKIGVGQVTQSIVALVANTEYAISYVRNNGIGTYYINNVACGSFSDVFDYSVASTRLFGTGGYFDGTISMCRIFNYALSYQQILNYSKPEYAIEYADRVVLTETISGGDFESGIIGTLLSDGGETSSWTLNTNSPISDLKDGLLVVSSQGTGATRPRITFNKTVGDTGKICKLSFKYKVNSGTCLFNGFWTGLSYIGAQTLSGTGIVRIYSKGFSDLSTCFCAFDGRNNFNIQIDNISCVQVGSILDLTSEGLTSGTWIDKTNTLTATNSATLFQMPTTSNLGAFNFNGLANIAYTGMNGLTGDITFAMKIIPILNLSSGYVLALPNGFCISIYAGLTAIQVKRDATTWVTFSTIQPNTTYILIITSTSAGITNVYINGVSVGTPNSNCGTPLSVTSWYFGGSQYNTINYIGKQSKPTIWNRILSTDEIQLATTILNQ